MIAVRIRMKRRDRRTYSGSLSIRDVFAGCRGGRNCGQQVVLQRQKNGAFASVGIVMSRFLDTTIWSGESVEEVETELLKILLEKYKRDEGWTDHGVLVRPIGDNERDAMAWPFLQPVLEGSIREVGELREQVKKVLQRA